MVKGKKIRLTCMMCGKSVTVSEDDTGPLSRHCPYCEPEYFGGKKRVDIP